MGKKLVRRKYLRVGTIEVLVDGEIKDTLTILKNGSYLIKHDKGSLAQRAGLLGIRYRNVDEMNDCVSAAARKRYQTFFGRRFPCLFYRGQMNTRPSLKIHGRASHQSVGEFHHEI